jgi:hypothetical protein
VEGPRPPFEKTPDVSHSNSVCASWAPACSVFAIDGIHVIAVRAVGGMFVLDVEIDRCLTGCPRCGVLAHSQGRRVHEVADAPAFGRPVRLRWSKRLWRCAGSACPTWTFNVGTVVPHVKMLAKVDRVPHLFLLAKRWR